MLFFFLCEVILDPFSELVCEMFLFPDAPNQRLGEVKVDFSVSLGIKRSLKFNLNKL